MICTWGYERQSNDKHKKKKASTAERSKMGLRIRKYKFAQQLLHENINLLNNNIKIYLLNNKIKKDGLEKIHLDNPWNMFKEGIESSSNQHIYACPFQNMQDQDSLIRMDNPANKIKNRNMRRRDRS